MGKFYILEFGGQHTDLIGDRLIAMGHEVRYSQSDILADQMPDANGIILSGGPKSVYQSDAYPYDPQIFNLDIPVLGICYGMQLMARNFGGQVHANGREYGQSKIKRIKNHPLFYKVPDESIVWMNHGDYVPQGNGDFDVLALSDKEITAAIAHGNNVAVQFHPELTHTDYGNQMLRNFAERICNSRPGNQDPFDEHRYLQTAIEEIRSEVGNRKAVAFLSGGVDSTIAYRLALEAGVRLVGVHLDMGIERKGEAQRVSRYLEKLSGQKVHVLDYEGMTLENLKGITDPEDKRKTFQDLYNLTFDDALRQLDLDKDDVILIQGTLATDRRESGKEAAQKDGADTGTVAKIKTHHNVSDHDRDVHTVEPLRYVSKDGARRIARALDLPEYVVNRQPFPGPGLVVRLITGVYPYETGLLTAVDSVANKHGFSGYALPVKTVGIKGDDRSFEYLALIVGQGDWAAITCAQKELAEELPVNRTVYANPRWLREDPLPISVRPLQFSKSNLDLLREATYIAETTFEEYGIRTAQLPVVMFPGSHKPWIAIRDVDSVDFRSVRPLRKPDEMPWEVCDETAERIHKSQKIARYGGVDAVVFDVSTKPAATTEWE